MQVTLEDGQHRRAKAKAAAAGVSLAEYLRRLVAADLGEVDAITADVTVLFDLGDSGGSDVARYKDRYIGEAVDSAHPRVDSSA
jgi:hypothetical protein